MIPDKPQQRRLNGGAPIMRTPDTADAAAVAARKRPQAVLAQLNPAGAKTEAIRPNEGKAGKKARKAKRNKT